MLVITNDKNSSKKKVAPFENLTDLFIVLYETKAKPLNLKLES